MAKCKFCNFDENGDISDDRKRLIDDKFYVNLNTSMAIDTGESVVLKHDRLDQEHEVYVDLTIINESDSGEPMLSLLLVDYPNYEDADYLIYSKRQKIKFCPICGRCLKNGKEN